MLTGGQDYGHSWTLHATRSRHEPSGGALFLVMVGLGNSPHMGPVVPTDDRSKLYAKTVTVHGNIQRTSPSTCKGGVQRTAGSDGNRCFVDTCKHVPEANSPPSTAAHLCMLLAEVGQVNGLLTVSQVHETSLRDVQ